MLTLTKLLHSWDINSSQSSESRASWSLSYQSPIKNQMFITIHMCKQPEKLSAFQLEMLQLLLVVHRQTHEIEMYCRFQGIWRCAELNLPPEKITNCGHKMAVIFRLDIGWDPLQNSSFWYGLILSGFMFIYSQKKSLPLADNDYFLIMLTLPVSSLQAACTSTVPITSRRP